MERLRILVVEDSLTMRRHIVDVLESEPGLEVIGEADDGKAAVDLCETLRPDVVTMDMMLSKMSGLAATEYIMAHCPTPILIISANRRELFKTYDALAGGAVDVLEKPTTDVSNETWRQDLIAKVRMVSRIRVITHLRGKLRSSGRSTREASPLLAALNKAVKPRLVAIGASTGGPGAILEILRDLPPEFDLPILLVLHIGGPFGVAFAEWLASQVRIPVSYAQDGAPVPHSGKGMVLMAPPDQHLVVSQGRIRLSQEPERHSCRPSVDVLFESIARDMAPGVIACLLTGIGRDGAEGLHAIRLAGGITLVQDEATSVVFGMPGEAIRIGAADRVLPLSGFADAISTLAGTRRLGVLSP